MTLKTAYEAIHEAAYRRRRSEGKPGWDDAGQKDRTMAALSASLDRLGLRAGSTALELGCGAGDMTLELARRGLAVQGIDVSPTALAWAREKLDHAGLTAQLVRGSVVDLSRFGDGAFDLVLGAHCLHCIVGDDRARVLREVQRVLRPGGRFHVLTMCSADADAVEASLASRPGLRFDRATRCVVRDGVAGRYIGSIDDLRREIEQAGFALCDASVLAASDVADLDEWVALFAAQPD